LAVDNEPEPFWTGADEVRRVERWMSQVDWSDAWGTVAPVSHLNAQSGRWFDERILGPLGVARADAWITDCLDTYRTSVKMRAAVDSVYEPFARTHGLPSAELAPHPSEDEIVSEGIDHHLDRLHPELTAAAPDVVVTLGNAALRVLQRLLGDPAGPMKLTVPGYGTELSADLDGAPHELAASGAPCRASAPTRRRMRAGYRTGPLTPNSRPDPSLCASPTAGSARRLTATSR